MLNGLQDIVDFRSDRLFNGAVNIGWFGTDNSRTRAAAEAFVFHGPAYHGVSQEDIGTSHGHRLQDTASFALSVVRRCYGIEDQPFMLAIAGYGTGKSHLGLTLASLLHNPLGDIAEPVLSGVGRADQAIGAEIKAILNEARQPCLVVALNGMQNFDLTTEVTRQILQQVKGAGLDTRPLDELRPRFALAASLIKMAVTNIDVTNDLLETCEAATIEDILDRLEEQDELTYGKVHQVLASRSINIAALGGESIRDVIDVSCREYCGPEKAFRCLIVLFDEFGRFTEFATVRSHIAGSGVLQDLFEGVQANAGRACFAGFIQFELSAYVQRVAPEHRNEILRYVTRYQAANRVYLSINLETLIASLIEKKQPEQLASIFDNDIAKQKSNDIAANLLRWYPQSRNHRLWGDTEQFHSVIRKGCWPLSAYSTWFLFHLAAAGKHLQERSALALLRDAFERHQGHVIDDETEWCLAPVDFWSEPLQHELITSEEGGQQGSITHAYASVEARHGANIEEELKRILRAVVLASKMGLKAADKDDAIEALSELAGLRLSTAVKAVHQLQDEYNVLEWDESFKEFDILGEAVPRTQFLAFVRHRVASAYDEAGKSSLFASKAATWCNLLCDLDCDFAEENRITTREWRYTGVTSNLDVIAMHVKLAADRWIKALSVDEARGTIIYCYVEPSRDAEVIIADTGKLLRSAAKQVGFSALPILVVLLCDEYGTLGQSLAELAVLDESVSEEDKVRFGNLIPAHQEKTREAVRSLVESMIKRRLYVTAFREPLEAKRLGRVGTELFARIYKSALLFPFDGFSTAHGNAPDSCKELTTELMLGRLDWGAVIAKQVRVKNRAVAVLRDAWGIYAQNGNVRTRPTQPIIRSLTEKWDSLLTSGERRIALGSAMIQLCAPPYGANIASAGLFLGAFIAARSEKICVVRDGKQYAVSQWVQDGLFRGKFIDIGTLNDIDLIHIGEESTEWESLLDEWEQSESHLARRSCLERAVELLSRIPVPPALTYRKIHLEEQSHASAMAIAEMEQRQNEALNKIEAGMDREDVGLLSWGASRLSELLTRMTNEKPLWLDHQIQELQPALELTRQTIIQVFPAWLECQAPRAQTPDAAGDFKHKMLRLIGGSLKKIGLGDLYDELERYTLESIRNIETAAEAHQILREVELWLTTHGDATRFVRVAELRALQQVGKEHASKLQGLSNRIQMPEISEMRSRLSETLHRMKDVAKGIIKRASKLWNSRLRSEDDMDNLLIEVEALINAFESCPNDLEDLQLMRQALRLYKKGYARLSDENLNWVELEALIKEIREEWGSAFGEEDPPWLPNETLDNFIQTIFKIRKNASATWIESIEAQVENIPSMAADEANRLYNRVNNPPPIVTDPHLNRAAVVNRKVQDRLDSLSVEWLLEKFKELPTRARRDFLLRIQQLGSA